MRSLYQCSQARVGFDGEPFIYCAKGHSQFTRDGIVLGYIDAQTGDPLNCDTCKDCADYSEIGGKIYDKGARGWK